MALRLPEDGEQMVSIGVVLAALVGLAANASAWMYLTLRGMRKSGRAGVKKSLYVSVLHHCPKCGNGIESDSKFCRNCGSPLGEASSEPISGATPDFLFDEAKGTRILARMNFEILTEMRSLLIAGMSIALALLWLIFILVLGTSREFARGYEPLLFYTLPEMP